jgi:hypothetical protein
MDAVERVRDSVRSSVELKLTFGDDTRLAVRVELCDGTVQTTFRTDSAELRQALASEWHHAMPSILATAPDQTARVAEPVFGPATTSADFAGASTGGNPNQRQAPAPASQDSVFLPSAPTGARNAPPAAAVPVRPLRLPTSLRLNVFA